MGHKHAVHFSSATDNWATPQWLFDQLNAEFGPLELDVCASADNAKCTSYYSLDGVSGLADSWHSYWPGERAPRCYMNPPYGRTIGQWVKKAYEESQKGCLVVCLLPARTDTRWFHDFIYHNPAAEVRFLKGRLKFGNAKNSAPFPSMVVVFRPGVKRG